MSQAPLEGVIEDVSNAGGAVVMVPVVEVGPVLRLCVLVEGFEEALFGSGRPSDALIRDRIGARELGGLLYTLMATVAYEGELLDVCAYDQPGVEAYKKIMKTRL